MGLSYSIRPPKLRILNDNVIIGIFFFYFDNGNLFISHANFVLISMLQLLLRPLQCHRKINSCLRFCNRASSYPNIVQQYLFERLEVNLFPNSNCVEIRSPIPRVLIASFSGVSINKWHIIRSLSSLINRFSWIYDNLKQIITLFKKFLNIDHIFSESVFGRLHFITVNKYISVSVDSLKDQLLNSPLKYLVLHFESQRVFDSAIGDPLY
jgi:hypothetical protein